MPQNLHVRTTAEQYDRFTATSVGAWDDLLIDRLVEEKRGRPAGGRLVDIGAGTAVVLMKLAARDDVKDLELIATDVFEDMLAVARARLAEASLSDRVRVERQDVHALSYPDGSVHYMLSRSTIHHWGDPVLALREIYRVLRPGGVALIHDVRRDAPPEIVAGLDAKRAALGIGPMLLDEKLTVDELRQICSQAELGARAQIHTTSSGPGALGFELRIAFSD